MALSTQQKRLLKKVKQLTKGGYRVSDTEVAKAMGCDVDDLVSDLSSLERVRCIDRGGLTKQIGFLADEPPVAKKKQAPRKTLLRPTTDQLLSELALAGKVRLYCTKKHCWVAELKKDEKPISVQASTPYAALYKLYQTRN